MCLKTFGIGITSNKNFTCPKEEDRASMGLAVQTTGEAIPGAETFKRKITPLVPVKAPEDDWEKYFP